MIRASPRHAHTRASRPDNGVQDGRSIVGTGGAIITRVPLACTSPPPPPPYSSPAPPRPSRGAGRTRRQAGLTGRAGRRPAASAAAAAAPEGPKRGYRPDVRRRVRVQQGRILDLGPRKKGVSRVLHHGGPASSPLGPDAEIRPCCSRCVSRRRAASALLRQVPHIARSTRG